MLLSLLWATVPALAENPFPYPVEQTVLDNGLTAYIVPMPSDGVTAVYTWMAVGSRDEVDVGRTGFAHFFEHLMFFGTPTLGGTDREDAIMSMGIDENAWTWFDETVYHGVVSAQNAERYLAIQADNFQNLSLTPDDVERESGAVYGEFRKGQASPDNAVSQALWSTAFQAHTYGHDTIGYEADIKAMPDAHTYAEAFFSRFYRPENAHVLIVGDVDVTEANRWLEAHWSSWKPGTEARPSIPVEPEQTEKREVHVDWATPTAPRLVMAWKIPAFDPTSPDAAAMTLAQDLLLSDIGSLSRRLVREEGLAYAVGGGDYHLADPALFTIDVTLKEPEDREAAEAIVREEIEKVSQSIEPKLLERLATQRRYAFLTGLDEPSAVANALGWHLRRNDDPTTLGGFYEQLSKVTPEDVQSAASAVFVDTHLTIATLTTLDDKGEK